LNCAEMTDSFFIARQVETESRTRLTPFIKMLAHDGQFCFNDNLGRNSYLRQKLFGDLSLQQPDGTLQIELKAEKRVSENLFLESWSNLNTLQVGWLWSSQADWLWYHFLESDALFICKMEELQNWSFKKKRIYDFREVEQSKHAQHNETCGRLVPILTLSSEIESFSLSLRYKNWRQSYEQDS